jgi:arabinose-5-phosphate isomerase
MASTGTVSFFVHPAEASHGDLGMISDDDVIIAISNGGESKELSDVLMYAKRHNIPIIAITRNPESSLGKNSTLVLKLPDSGEACPLGLAPTSSTTATLALGDALAVSLMYRKNFTSSDYKQRHPGGKLGSILKRVSELMHTGEEMPLLPQSVNMQQALLEMSRKRLGCVGFTDDFGRLAGILTDGDLRRKLNADTFSAPVMELMTKTPITIQKDTLNAEAIKIMNEKKITNLFVLENGKPVGVIHIHDLLGKGVA